MHKRYFNSHNKRYWNELSIVSIVCIWDIRPFAPQDRCIKTLSGHQHNFEKNLLKCNWSPDGSKVTAGSADRFVYIWDVTYKRILYKLPGHLGSVNEVVFHPNEPIGNYIIHLLFVFNNTSNLLTLFSSNSLNSVVVF